MFPYHRPTMGFPQVCTPDPDGTPMYACDSNLIKNDNNSDKLNEKNRYGIEITQGKY